MLGTQGLTVLCLFCWSTFVTVILLYSINKIIPIRMDPNEELLGADLTEHRIHHAQIGISRALAALAPIHPELNELFDVPKIGINPGHEACIDEIRAAHKEFIYNDWDSPGKSRGKSTKGRKASHSQFVIKDEMFKRKDSKASASHGHFGKSGRVVKHTQIIPAEKDRYVVLI